MPDPPNEPDLAITLETATNWARSNREWDKVYRYLFLHPKDFFVILPGRRWPIAHQVVYHGDVDLLKRILALADDQFDIRTKSVDNKNLLDVAKEKLNTHPAMHTYVEHLFDQDQLIHESKQGHWREVKELLNKNSQLANEKPPYSPCFLLHYIVEYGDATILQELLNRYEFLTNVLNTKNESPLDMASRLDKEDMCIILRPKTVARPSFVQKQESTEAPPATTTSEPPKTQQSELAKQIHIMTKTTYIGFEGVALDINQNGDITVGQNTLFNSAANPLPPLPPSVQQPKPKTPASTATKPPAIPRVIPRKSIIRECSLTDEDPPAPPQPELAASSSAMKEQLMKNFVCPLTKQVLVDPVIAPDGQTYERTAILRWIEQNHTSPTTGAAMDANIRDNNEIKGIIQLIQNQK